MSRMLLLLHHIAFAPHALHHNALSSYMAHLSIRPRVRRAGIGSASGASSSQRLH
jgi:hypothetical protein